MGVSLEPVPMLSHYTRDTNHQAVLSGRNKSTSDEVTKAYKTNDILDNCNDSK